MIAVLHRAGALLVGGIAVLGDGTAAGYSGDHCAGASPRGEHRRWWRWGLLLEHAVVLVGLVLLLGRASALVAMVTAAGACSGARRAGASPGGEHRRWWR
jgi:hypothetical protein